MERDEKLMIWVKTQGMPDEDAYGIQIDKRKNLLSFKQEVVNELELSCRPTDITLIHSFYSFSDDLALLSEVFKTYQDDDVILVSTQSRPAPLPLSHSFGSTSSASASTSSLSAPVPSPTYSHSHEAGSPLDWFSRQQTFNDNYKNLYRSTPHIKRESITDRDLTKSKSAPKVESDDAPWKLKQGNVKKKKNMGFLLGDSWRSKYLSLSSNQLHIFKSKEECLRGTRPKETIPLLDIISCGPVAKGDKKFTILAAGRSLEILCPTSAEAVEWVAQILKNRDRLRTHRSSATADPSLLRYSSLVDLETGTVVKPETVDKGKVVHNHSLAPPLPTPRATTLPPSFGGRQASTIDSDATSGAGRPPTLRRQRTRAELTQRLKHVGSDVLLTSMRDAEIVHHRERVQQQFSQTLKSHHQDLDSVAGTSSAPAPSRRISGSRSMDLAPLAPPRLSGSRQVSTPFLVSPGLTSPTPLPAPPGSSATFPLPASVSLAVSPISVPITHSPSTPFLASPSPPQNLYRDLPIKVLYLVFCFTGLDEFKNTASVCRRWKEYTNKLTEILDVDDSDDEEKKDDEDDSLGVPIIIDTGTSQHKAGFAGAEWPTVLYSPNFEEKKLKVVSKGEIKEWEYKEEDYKEYERAWGAIFKELKADVKNQPVLITQPILTPKGHEDRLLSILFDKFNAPGVFLEREPILTAYCYGYFTALVVDIGHTSCQIAAFVDGHLIEEACMRVSHLSGRSMQMLLEKLMKPKAVALNVDPSSAEFSAAVQRIRETMTIVVEDYAAAAKDPSKYARVFELPAGVPPAGRRTSTKTTLSSELIAAGELLFSPRTVLQDAESTLYSVPELIQKCISATQQDNREKLLAHILLSGGVTRIPGFDKRLADELKRLLPHAASKLRVIPNMTQREKLVWAGGSLLVGIESFKFKDRSTWEEERVSKES